MTFWWQTSALAANVLYIEQRRTIHKTLPTYWTQLDTLDAHNDGQTLLGVCAPLTHDRLSSPRLPNGDSHSLGSFLSPMETPGWTGLSGFFNSPAPFSLAVFSFTTWFPLLSFKLPRFRIDTVVHYYSNSICGPVLVYGIARKMMIKQIKCNFAFPLNAYSIKWPYFKSYT